MTRYFKFFSCIRSNRCNASTKAYVHEQCYCPSPIELALEQTKYYEGYEEEREHCMKYGAFSGGSCRCAIDMT